MADIDYKSENYWTEKAKREGYPARSVYKLEELQKQYNIIPKKGIVLDVGAAPGSWTLFVSKKILKGEGKVVAVDLKPLSLSPLPSNVQEFTGDAFSEAVLPELKSFGEYDAIISDAAPSTTGNRGVDTARSSALVLNVIALASECLKKGSSMCIKIFQGEDFDLCVKQMRQLFSKVVIHKPKACRQSSFETYLIGISKKL